MKLSEELDEYAEDMLCPDQKLIDKAKQLEAQIEKMKCCENCVHMDARNQMMYGEPDECQIDVGYCFDYGYPNWEIEE